MPVAKMRPSPNVTFIFKKKKTINKVFSENINELVGLYQIDSKLR